MKYAADYRAMGRETMRRDMKGCILACLIMTAVTVVLDGILRVVPDAGMYTIIMRPDGLFEIRMNPNPPIVELAAKHPLLGLLYLALVGIVPALEVGLCRFFLNLVDGQSPRPAQVLSGFSVFWRALWLYVQMVVRVFLWSLLLVIPGIIASYRYSQARYILADHPEMTASQAIAESSRMMQGHKWQLFCLQLSFIGWMILSLFTMMILQVLYVGPYMQATYACFYRDLVTEDEGRTWPEEA